MVKVAMVVAPQNFRDEELLEPKKVLESAGAKVKIASKGVSSATGMLGAKVTVNMDYSEIKVSDFDAIVFVGGTGASIYFKDNIALNLVKNFFNEGKVVAAICIAPTILANAGILNGKKATAFASENLNISSKGAKFTGAEVEVDGRIITASGPRAARNFGEAILRSI